MDMWWCFVLRCDVVFAKWLVAVCKCGATTTCSGSTESGSSEVLFRMTMWWDIRVVDNIHRLSKITQAQSVLGVGPCADWTLAEPKHVLSY